MTIAEFLLKLAGDDELLQRFKDNPAEVLRDEKDLDHEQLALLRAGRLVDLRVKIDAEFEVAGERVAMHTIYMPTIYGPQPPSPPPPPRPHK
jgi:hypothetical protein